MIEYGTNTIGAGLQVFEPVTLGFPSRDKIGKNAVLRYIACMDACIIPSIPAVGGYCAPEQIL